jgi:WD40 repeat protein
VKPTLTAAFGRDDRFLAKGDGDGTLRVYEFPSLKQVFESKQQGGVAGVAFGEAGRALVAGWNAGTTLLIDTQSWKVRHSIKRSPVWSHRPKN